ncbi:MAG TPA: hypothetical protein VL899_09880 [Alphaproteobacteria bacterium]|nr:hypothetical protein [Alphaproteobacteria bacterium]
MTTDPSLARAADDTAGRQPLEAGQPSEAAAARDGRRMARLAALERLRARAEKISEKLCDLIDDTLPPAEREPFARIVDPTLAFTRVATAIRRIVAIEEQIDEDAEERAVRLANEAAQRAKATAEAERLPVDRRIHMRASRRIAHQAVRDAITARDSAYVSFQRENLLNDLTADLDDLDYAENLDLILAQIGKELDAILGPADPDGEAEDAQDAEEDEDEEAPAPAATRLALSGGSGSGSIAEVYAALKRATDALGLQDARRESG